MNPAKKYALRGTLFCILGMIFIISAMSEFVILFNLPVIFIFIVPAIASVIIIIIIVLIYFGGKKAGSIFDEKRIYQCTECGSPLKLRNKFCDNCGTENIHRIQALEKLEEMEKLAEENRVKLLEKMQSKKRKTPRTRKLEEESLELLDFNIRKVKSRKEELIRGKKSFEVQDELKIKCHICGYWNNASNRLCNYCGRKLIKKS